MAGIVELAVKSHLKSIDGDEDELEKVKLEVVRLARFIDKETELQIERCNEMDRQARCFQLAAVGIPAIIVGLVFLIEVLIGS